MAEQDDAQGQAAPTLFDWAGGAPALLRMTRIFYQTYVPNDELLAPVFAGMAPDHPQRVAAWLGEVFRGPAEYSTTYGGYPRMLARHLGRGLTEEWRARWVELLVRSAHDAGLPDDPEFASAFRSYLEWGSRLAVENSQPGAHPPQHLPVPHWDWGPAGPPGVRISALAPVIEKETVMVQPTDSDQVSFAQHVQPMFRESDRRSMQFAFDLWSHDDVSVHADDILGALRNGSMPCDGAWPQDQVDTFQRWVDAGKPA